MNDSWKKKLSKQLVKQFGDKKGKQLTNKYLNALPGTYPEQYTAHEALVDIVNIEKLSCDNRLVINFHKTSQGDYPLHIKLYRYGTPMFLSDILPMIENMGLNIFSEQPYRMRLNDQKIIWISDFSVTYPGSDSLNIETIKDLFNEALLKVSNGDCENDAFNKLVLNAGLTWREITIIRTYAKYIHQIGFRFDQSYIQQTINDHAAITKELVALFYQKFQPKQSKNSEKKSDDLNNDIQTRIDNIISLDEDRIMRYFWSLIKASLRTNYFQTNSFGQSKDYISIKLKSALVPDLPPGQPMYEIFVYSTRFEAIHLRSSKVARGGIRWSDRPQDFRTEILGLMKAQKVKNSVIVPSGAKGGFVLKKMAGLNTREQIMEEVIHNYTSFIRGLLDITDNLKNEQVVPPENTVCHDEADPYLVVAADKGTATFSDTANAISNEYAFWLGDAFASGGSAGYDHKKMGITARGTWESIKRHFMELDVNIHEQDFSAVGIGDMGGDVFGNGLIYSKHTRLLAAFDHRNIFLDPDPDALTSYKERKRLFNAPHSTWEDYNPKLISKGGGVYKRSSKSILLSKEVKKALAIEKNALTPNELIQAILKAPVDLLFNGGIGTYVKAVSESNADVGDKANEYTRVNGIELRCKVVGEGGNLGVTQLGRVEYALNGGLINSDSIDNSAGVSCSDHEVNIKILLNREMQNGTLTEKKRDQLLTKMTDDVAELVLKDNYNQALVLSFSAAHSAHYSGLYQSYIQELESIINLDRVVEHFPDNKKLLERKTAGLGLVRPELAVLMAYTKILITSELLKSDLPDDPYFIVELKTAFPSLLAKSYMESMKEHRLRREIIATQLSNHIVNSVGITFMYRMQIETGASIADIARAYTLASNAYQTNELQHIIDSLNYKVPVQVQYELLHYIRQLLNLATRWFLRNQRFTGNIDEKIAHYKKSISRLNKVVSDLMVGVTKKYLDELLNKLAKTDLKESVIRKISLVRATYTVLNVIEVATQNNFDLTKTNEVYFKVGERFNLVWFRDQVANDTREGHWNNMARLSLRDELDKIQRRLTIVIMKSNKKEKNATDLIAGWLIKNKHIQQRWEKLLKMLYESPSVDYTRFFIALGQLSSML